MSRTLDEWLVYQQQVHKRDIAFGLERIRSVWERMGSPRAPLAITVGGTNGKGSTVAFLTAMLRAAGVRVGSYVSPHVSVYNERIRVDDEQADDATLCASFARIEAARADVLLTYFEYATLAALDIFARAGVEVMVLEVGLGGRLDATNIVDADVAVITTIDLDHMQWLGPDRDSIGAEKAGIARAHRPVIVGELDPPQGLLRALTHIGARMERADLDFGVEADGDRYRWWHGDGQQVTLPDLPLAAPCQQANAAAALAALHALGKGMRWQPAVFAEGLKGAHLRGRLQSLGHAPERLVDVAHNPQAARVLAAWLDQHPVTGKVVAVYGAVGDKDVKAVVSTLGSRITHWHLGGLEAETPRGLAVDELAQRFRDALPGAGFDRHADVGLAWQTACREAARDDLVVAFGSFFVVSRVLAESAG